MRLRLHNVAAYIRKHAEAEDLRNRTAVRVHPTDYELSAVLTDIRRSRRRFIVCAGSVAKTSSEHAL